MRVVRCLSFLCLLILVAGATIAPAEALTTSHFSSDKELLAIFSETMFVAEGRIGDGIVPGTFELEMGEEPSMPEVAGHFEWPNGTPVSFTLTYDALTSEIAFTAGDSTLYLAPRLLDYPDMFVRAGADLEDSQIIVEDLVLDGEVVGDVAYAAGIDDVDIMWIAGATLYDGFTLTGTVTMSWTGTQPAMSELLFQVKLGAPAPTDTVTKGWGKIKSLYR